VIDPKLMDDECMARVIVDAAKGRAFSTSDVLLLLSHIASLDIANEALTAENRATQRAKQEDRAEAMATYETIATEMVSQARKIDAMTEAVRRMAAVVGAASSYVYGDGAIGALLDALDEYGKGSTT
jgi:hypothetical protein